MLNSFIFSIIYLFNILFILALLFTIIYLSKYSEKEILYFKGVNILIFSNIINSFIILDFIPSFNLFSLLLITFFILVLRHFILSTLILLLYLLLVFYNSFYVDNLLQLIVLLEVIFVISTIAPYIIWSKQNLKADSLVFLLNLLKWNILSTTAGVFLILFYFFIFGDPSVDFLKIFSLISLESISIYSISVFYLLFKLSSWFIVFFKQRFYKKSSLELLAFFNFCYFWFVQIIFLPIILSWGSVASVAILLAILSSAYIYINFINKTNSLTSFVLITSLLTYTSILPILLFC